VIEELSVIEECEGPDIKGERVSCARERGPVRTRRRTHAVERLTVVAQQPHGLRAPPAREGVGAEPARVFVCFVWSAATAAATQQQRWLDEANEHATALRGATQGQQHLHAPPFTHDADTRVRPVRLPQPSHLTFSQLGSLSACFRGCNC
jgi:hypothetical protein